MARVKVRVGGLTEPGTYPVRVEAVECVRGLDLIWTLAVREGTNAGKRILMVTPLNAESQLWLLKKALVSIGVIQKTTKAVDLEWNDHDGRVVNPAMEGKIGTARITRRPKGPRVELLTPRAA